MFVSRVLFVCFLVLAATTGAATADDQRGSATRSGTNDGLARAVAEVARARAAGDSSPRTIRLPAGTHRLTRAIELTERVVGEGLTIRGSDDGKTVISGAVVLQPSGHRDGKWRYTIPGELTQATDVRFLVIDGRLRSAARHPNVGYLRIAAASADRRSGFEFAPEDIPAALDLDQGRCDLVFLHDWSSSRLPVRTIDHRASQLTTLGPIGCAAPHYAIDHFEKNPRYFLEGHPALADVPGEWFVDQAAGEIVLLDDNRRPGKKSADGQGPPPVVELPVSESLFVVTGDEGRPVQNLALQGLVFSGSRFPMPAGGLAGAQATMHEPRDADGAVTVGGRPMLSAAVVIEQARDCRITDCRFVGLGNTALWLGTQTRDCLVNGCRFDDVGGNAINVGENNSRQINGKPWYEVAAGQVPTDNRIIECQIRHCGVILPGSVAIWAAFNRRLEIADNSIEDCPYTGISLGWMWNDRPTPAGENHVHDNQIRHVMQVLSDGGGIYTLGRQPGTRLEKNVITNVPLNAGRAESNGMFLDEGTSGLTIRDNEFRRIARSPLRFHKAGENTVVGNRWELETEQTPAIRFNNTPEQNITVRPNQVLDRQPRIYLIGNSLTWDTRPGLLDHYVDWHVDCGKNLQFIFDHPVHPCVDSSRLWPIAVNQLQYDYLCLQPHYGTTLDQDIDVISRWMRMQPDAIVVLHTGWAHSATAGDEFSGPAGNEMTHHVDYFGRLKSALSEKFPDRTIRQTDAFQALHRIAIDITTGAAPLDDLTDLYRDAIHMTQDGGRYLMHNLMRKAVDQPASDEGFDTATKRPELKAYLDTLIGDTLVHDVAQTTEPVTASLPDVVEVFKAGQDGYPVFRIPALIETAGGDLLAFCEARQGNDASEIDIVTKRSADGGRTWGPLRVVIESDDYEHLYGDDPPPITIGNPSPVVDRLAPDHPGRIWLPFTIENEHVFIVSSDDDGQSWGTPRDITSDVKKPGWGWYATGPVHSIQIQHGPHRGRLVIPADHRLSEAGQDRGPCGAQLILSDDYGKTWRLGAIDEVYDDALEANETTVTELPGGVLYINTRDQNGPAPGTRGEAFSDDGGETFRSDGADRQAFHPFDGVLDPPVVQCSLLTVAGDLVVFCGPDENGPSGKGRSDLRLRVSRDGCQTWQDGPLIHEGPAAYSDMVLPETPSSDRPKIGVLYEAGSPDQKSPYRSIRFARIDPS